MHILPTISTSLIIISAVLMLIGISHIRKGNIEKHETFMKFAAIAAIGFFTIYASRTLFVGNTSFGGPEAWVPFYTAFLIFHIILATTGAVLGLMQLYSGFKRKLDRHRKMGYITATVWFFTAFTGTIVYVLLYILYTGETTSLWDAILNN